MSAKHYTVLLRHGVSFQVTSGEDLLAVAARTQGGFITAENAVIRLEEVAAIVDITAQVRVNVLESILLEGATRQ